MVGALDLDRLVAASDDEVRRKLLALRGIGRWTADVYLLFALRRLDAWAERWRPMRAVAARFLWHDYLSRRGRGCAPERCCCCRQRGSRW